MADLKTIILAAGKGTRMRSELPKVLHKVCGKPILNYVLGIANSVGSLRTFVVLGHQIETVRKTLPKDIICVEQKNLLGTGDAVKQVEKYLRDDRGQVLILCGDTPLLTVETVKLIIQKQQKSKAACTFLTAVVDDPSGYGRVIRNPQSQVIAIREDKDATWQEKQVREINVGVYSFRCKDLYAGLKNIKLNPNKKEYYLTDLIDIFVRQNLLIETVKTPNAQEGLGVNTRIDLAMAEEKMRFKILKNFMLEGVTIIDPKTTYIADDVKLGTDTIIYPCTVIEENVKVGKNCKIGPFARIRPGSVIADNVEIGNFTEVSRSSIGSGTFMKHFSFIGDAKVGANANIGAGCVTANFDGINKNQTIISDGAFIGSDAILVAPVKIGKKAVVGAGAVVKKNTNVPDGKIAVGVPARIMARKK